MIKEILPNLYNLEIPLPDTPLKALNSYLIKGEGRNLLIDTGFNHKICLDAMHLGLSELGVDLRDTDIFITHYHSDHAGLVPTLAIDSSTVYCSKEDSIKLLGEMSDTHGDRGEVYRSFLEKHGFPSTQFDLAMENNPGFKYLSRSSLKHTTLKDGDTLCAGSYRFRCILTPGHTKGHMCLYEPEKKLLVAGDHILGKISPNISLSSENENPLKEYLLSLEKVAALDIDLGLPGHRNIITNCRERILELKDHCLRRSDEVFAILGKGSKTGYQVAAEVEWDLNGSWEFFPDTQKMFASWEALAHLIYLEEKQVVKREERDQKVVFSLT